jgi:putative SOS response-associated peptidase YedK
MCGRFHNHVKAMHDWVNVLSDWPNGAALSHNVAPTQSVPIVTASGALNARWGLVPRWEKAFSTKYPTHNARLETAAEKPSFRSPWKQSQTCLVPAGGYYEWRKEGSIKQPYFIHKPDDLLVFAGLWEAWNDSYSFTLLTTAATKGMAELHHRMPVMLDTHAARLWLNTGTSEAAVLEQTNIPGAIDYYPVSTAVNTSKNEGPHLINRLPP